MRQIFLEGRPLAIFPCRNKFPFAGSHGFLDATADPVAIGALWQKFPSLQFGVATGSVSGSDVLDIDPRKGGDRWFHEHRADIPQTRTHETPGGGWHLIFRHSLGLRCSQGVIARGIDVKANGGYVVWYPASAGRVLCEGPVAEWPQWILELAGRNSSSAAPLTAADGAGSPPMPRTSPTRAMAAGFPVSSGERNGPLLMVRAGEVPKALYFKVLDLVPISPAKNLNILKTSVDASQRKRVTCRHQRWVLSILRTLIEKRENRNEALNDAGYSFRPLIARGIVTYRGAESLLIDAATLNQYVAKDGRRAAILTIRSGLGGANRRRPSSVLDEGLRHE
jgi:hypothetical protein